MATGKRASAEQSDPEGMELSDIPVPRQIRKAAECGGKCSELGVRKPQGSFWFFSRVELERVT